MDATQKIADGYHWHFRSKIAEKYLDKNVPSYFHGGFDFCDELGVPYWWGANPIDSISA